MLATLVEVPYHCSPPLELSMVFILPDQSSEITLRKWCSNEKFTWENMAAAVCSMEAQRIDLTIPKFAVESTIRLKDILKSMGMVTPFDQKASFANMVDTSEGIYISDVIHAAKVSRSGSGSFRIKSAV